MRGPLSLPSLVTLCAPLSAPLYQFRALVARVSGQDIDTLKRELDRNIAASAFVFEPEALPKLLLLASTLDVPDLRYVDRTNRACAPVSVPPPHAADR